MSDPPPARAGADRDLPRTDAAAPRAGGRWRGIRAWWERRRGAAWIDLPLRAIALWSAAGGTRLAAAVSYYTAFSLAPLLVLGLAVAGLAVDAEVLAGHLHGQLGGLLGEDAARTIDGLLRRAREPEDGAISAAISLPVLAIGATTVFVEMKGALDALWGVRLRRGLGWRALVLRYLAPLSMIAGIGFLLLVSLLVSAFLAGISGWMRGVLPGWTIALRILDQAVGVGLFALLFTLIYKVLPDVRIGWRDAAAGGLVAAVLFAIGRWAIGMYIGRTSVASAYGAAGSFAVILVWVYYSAQILYLGAAWCRARRERRGSAWEPTPMAERLPAVSG